MDKVTDYGKWGTPISLPDWPYDSFQESDEEVPGQWWISCDVLCVGDYGGAGDIGEANIRALERDKEKGGEETYEEHGSHGYRQLWLLDTDDNRDIIVQLQENYPLYDEEEHSDVQIEWEWEAFDSYYDEELLSHLDDDSEGYLWREYADDCLSKENRFRIYRRAMDDTNTYPTPEYNGVHVRIDRIQGTYAVLIRRDCSGRIKKLRGWEDWNHSQTDALHWAIMADWVDEAGDGKLAGWMRANAKELAEWFKNRTEQNQEQEDNANA